MTLNSTINSEIVEPFQVVVFTCISTGSGIINWFSNKYIGTDSLPLQIIAAGNTTIVSSNHDPNTVATKISVTNDTGEIVIVSKLRIIISSLYLMATVSCDNGDRGLRQSINFSMTLHNVIFAVIMHIIIIILSYHDKLCIRYAWQCCFVYILYYIGIIYFTTNHAHQG